MISIRLAAAALVLAAGASPVLADDRAPSTDERAKIEAALKADGFSSWGDIEFDDGRVWEIDDARHADGKEYKVDVDSSFVIIKRDPD